MMRFSITAAGCLLLILFLIAGCAEQDYYVTEKDYLTEAEKDAIASHARKFLARARKLKITAKERQLISIRKPRFNIHYQGYKRGVMILRWELPEYRVLLLQRTGSFLSDNQADWMVRLITDKATRKIPKNYFGTHGEDIAL